MRIVLPWIAAICLTIGARVGLEAQTAAAWAAKNRLRQLRRRSLRRVGTLSVQLPIPKPWLRWAMSGLPC